MQISQQLPLRDCQRRSRLASFDPDDFIVVAPDELRGESPSRFRRFQFRIALAFRRRWFLVVKIWALTLGAGVPIIGFWGVARWRQGDGLSRALPFGFSILVLLGASTLGVYLLRKRRPTLGIEHAMARRSLVSHAEATAISRNQALSGRYAFDEDVIFDTSRYLRNQASRTSRINHSITQSGNIFEHEFERILVGPITGANHVPRIAHFSEKHEMSDRLNIEVNGKLCPPLSTAEARALTVEVLTAWWSTFFPTKTGEIQEVWDSLMTAVTADLSVSTTGEGCLIDSLQLKTSETDGDRVQFESYLQDILHDLERGRWGNGWSLLPSLIVGERAQLGPRNRSADARALVETIKRLAHSELIWVYIPPGNERHAVMTVRYRAPLRLKESQRGEARRLRYGLVPRNVALDLPLSRQTASYHLNFSTPHDMYLYNSSIEYFVDRESAPVGKANTRATPISPEDLRFRGARDGHAKPSESPARLGSTLVHVNLRNMPALGVRRQSSEDFLGVIPAIRLDFREVPPGNLLWAIVLALYVSILTWTVGLNFDEVFPKDPNIPVSSVVSALLFGLPAILSGVVLNKVTTGSIQTISFATAGAILGTLGNAVVVTVVAVYVALTKSRGPVPPIESVFGLRVSGTTATIPWAWCVLMLLSACNLGLLAVMMFERRERYSRRIK